jgi:hypothetical protein
MSGLGFVEIHRPESRQVFEMIGGRTRTRTLDPLIKSQPIHFQARLALATVPLRDATPWLRRRSRILSASASNLPPSHS